MSEFQEFVTIQEATVLVKKPEITIRRLIKKTKTDYQMTNQRLSGVIISDYQSGRLIYKINTKFLLNRFNLIEKTIDNQSDSQVTISDYQMTSKRQSGLIVSDEQEISKTIIDEEQKEITADYINTLKIQLLNKDDEIKRLHQLMENQQRITMHTQLQIEKLQLSLTTGEKKEETKKRKKVLGIF